MFLPKIIRIIFWFIAIAGLAISFVLLHELMTLLTGSVDALSPQPDSIFWYHRSKNIYAAFCSAGGLSFLTASALIIFGLVSKRSKTAAAGALLTFVLVFLLSVAAILRV